MDQNEVYEKVYEEPVKARQSNMALASLVMGIIGIVTFCCCGGILFGSLGIIFALLSKTEQQFEGYAKAGLITSSIAIGLVVVMAIFYFVLIIAGIASETGGVY